MHDLDKPLKIVNKTLWEELSGYTEKEVCKSLLFLFLPNLRGPWKCDEFTSLQRICCHSSDLSALNLKRGTISSEKQAKFGLMR